MNLWTSVFVILVSTFLVYNNLYTILNYYPWLKLSILVLVISALISRLFLMKDGYILGLKDNVPRVIGRRYEDSKWNKYFIAFISVGLIFIVVAFFILFLKSEV